MECLTSAGLADIFGAERVVDRFFSAFAADENGGVGVNYDLRAFGYCVLRYYIKKRLNIFWQDTGHHANFQSDFRHFFAAILLSDAKSRVQYVDHYAKLVHSLSVLLCFESLDIQRSKNACVD